MRRSGARAFLGTAAAAAAAASIPFQALASRAAAAEPMKLEVGPGYGPLAPVRDQATGLELLALPKGFEYFSYGWANPMSDGVPTPGSHDGMAAFRIGDRIHLVRNHERNPDQAFTTPAYDPMGGGGTSTLVFDPDAGRFLDSHASLGGTLRNCAGGPTPCGTWPTCEETFSETPHARHGYVFEVPAEGKSDAVPYVAMGRFNHEAVAVDPNTGIVYETEDRGDASLYRFVPDVPVNLARGGRLQALSIGPGVVDTRRDDSGPAYGVVGWLDIDEPDPVMDTVRREAQGKGSAIFGRLEGAWYGNDRIYVITTNGGPVGQGQVFELDPATDELRVLFASPSAEVLNAPDNMCVSPRGGLVLCEDGSGEEFVHGLTTDGEIFPFAKNVVDLRGGAAGKNVAPNDYRGSEWAGRSSSPTTATGSSSTSRAPASRSPSPGRGGGALSSRNVESLPAGRPVEGLSPPGRLSCAWGRCGGAAVCRGWGPDWPSRRGAVGLFTVSGRRRIGYLGTRRLSAGLGYSYAPRRLEER